MPSVNRVSEWDVVSAPVSARERVHQQQFPCHRIMESPASQEPVNNQHPAHDENDDDEDEGQEIGPAVAAPAADTESELSSHQTEILLQFQVSFRLFRYFASLLNVSFHESCHRT